MPVLQASTEVNNTGRLQTTQCLSTKHCDTTPDQQKHKHSLLRSTSSAGQMWLLTGGAHHDNATHSQTARSERTKHTLRPKELFLRLQSTYFVHQVKAPTQNLSGREWILTVSDGQLQELTTAGCAPETLHLLSIVIGCSRASRASLFIASSNTWRNSYMRP